MVGHPSVCVREIQVRGWFPWPFFVSPLLLLLYGGIYKVDIYTYLSIYKPLAADLTWVDLYVKFYLYTGRITPPLYK
jgi:hypothetical protein